MSSFDLPQPAQPRVNPALLVGAASPLWSYFGAVAAGGMAYWWMTRWARPVNLEAMFGAAKALPAAAPVAEPLIEAADAVLETVAEAPDVIADAVADAAPLVVGGEAAPMSPLLAASSEPEPEPEAEVMFAVAPEPVIDEPAPVAMDAASEPAPKPKAKKAVAPPPEADA